MSADHASKVFEFGPFRLSAEDGALTRGGQKVPLPLKAADVLLLLVASAPRLVTKKEIFDVVWPQTTVTPETLNYYIHLIREALQPGLDREAIETVRGRGFRFVLPVTTLSPTVATLEPLRFATAVQADDRSGGRNRDAPARNGGLLVGVPSAC